MKTKKDYFEIAFGKCIRLHRINCEMTQKELADNLGVSQVCIQYWEQGKRSIDFYWVIKICTVLRFDIRDFINDYVYYYSML